MIGRDGATRASIGGGLLAVAANDPVRLPCAGDWVVVRTWPDERTTIEAVLPRRTAVVRASAGAESVAQVLAANVDTAAVVASVDPEPDLARIERLLALAWDSGAEPVVILAKTDLARNPVAIAEQVSEVTSRVPVHPISAANGTGLEPVRALCTSGRTLGLLGVSGCGKSTLVNALAGAVVMGTQAIRQADGRGRHTTTYRALIPLPGGGAVLDTPGIRGVGMFDGVAGLERTFADIDALARTCRFRDCSHNAEPGCTVVAAVATGELLARRLHSWRKLRTEVAYEVRRSAARSADLERLRWKRLAAVRRGGPRP